MLVTGDCGTSDHDALLAARARGIDVIVIDHHELPEGETAAYALVSSRRPDDAFPFKGLASCGVAFYLAAALRTRLGAAFDPRDLLDLVALGTIADMVPLVEENRILVAAGLTRMSTRKRPGVAALAARAELATGQITATDVAFRLTPRLNAAGRLGEAQLALDLLLAANDADAERLAGELEEQNTERQRIQELVWKEALGQATAQLQDGDPAAHGRRRRRLASRRGRHHRRAPGRPVLAARGGDRFSRRGGARLGADGGRREPLRRARALRRPADQVRRPRGRRRDEHHSRTSWTTSARAFVAEAARQLGSHRRDTVEVDAEVMLRDLDVPFAEELARLAPFGVANREPLFALSGVTARLTRLVGKNHLQLTLDHGGATSEAIAFGFAESDPGAGARVDLVATAELDTFRGLRRARLKVSKLAKAE